MSASRRRCRLLQLCWFGAREQHQVVGDHRGPDVGLEVVEPAPGAACSAIGAFEAGDAGLDPGAEVAQPAIDPGLLTMSATAMLHFLWKATSSRIRKMSQDRQGDESA